MLPSASSEIVAGLSKLSYLYRLMPLPRRFCAWQQLAALHLRPVGALSRRSWRLDEIAQVDAFSAEQHFDGAQCREWLPYFAVAQQPVVDFSAVLDDFDPVPGVWGLQRAEDLHGFDGRRR